MLGKQNIIMSVKLTAGILQNHLPLIKSTFISQMHNIPGHFSSGSFQSL